MELDRGFVIHDEDEQPEWFLNLVGHARSVGKEHHDILEGILGVSRLLREDPKTAFVLTHQILQTIAIYGQDPTIPSEQRSTQIDAMIRSGLYPSGICERVKDIMSDE